MVQKKQAKKKDALKRKSSVKRTQKKTKARKKRVPQKKNSGLKSVIFKVLLFIFVVFGLYVIYLDSLIRYAFEGRKWAIPAHVYARPLELYIGKTISSHDLQQELTLLGYHRSIDENRQGSYQQRHGVFEIISRDFHFADGYGSAQHFDLVIKNNKITALREYASAQSLPVVRLDPYQFAQITAANNEDRILLAADKIPKVLLKALTAVEDRRFYEHIGIDFLGLARASVANIKAGRVVQGGSTLTQQLVKNFFLNRDKTVIRKIKEAIMAPLIEWRYSKEEILTAYCNEVFLGQDGGRAIHGFALASQFFFGSNLEYLKLPEIALLVGMLKGPSYYDPRRFPERAIKRRNQVLKVLAEQHVVSDSEAQYAMLTPLGVRSMVPKTGRFSSFLDLVRQQLKRDYKEADLRSAGLHIYTTLDPIVQTKIELSVAQQMEELSQKTAIKDLQVATVVSTVGSGEVVALVGGKQAQRGAYNRALHVRRQIGSLVKPAVYLTALERMTSYNLISELKDEAVKLNVQGDKIWAPENFDRQYRGAVPLYKALLDSLNVPTVRLGITLGISDVIDLLQRLGLEVPGQVYPSLLLGAYELTPYEVTQMFQAYADGGFVTPLRAIRAVVTSSGVPLQQYALEVSQAVDANALYLLQYILEETVRSGTAKNLPALLPDDLTVAGKTGTTNDLRDSWFAGFSGQHVAVVWVGRDNHQSAKLTGASGAMRVWGGVVDQLETQSLESRSPDAIEWVWVDPKQKKRVASRCSQAKKLPFIKGTAPKERGSCH